MSHIEKKISWITKYGKYAFTSMLLLAFSLIGITQVKKVSQDNSANDIDGSDYQASSLVRYANAQGDGGDGGGDDASWSGNSAPSDSCYGDGGADDCGDAGGGGDCY